MNPMRGDRLYVNLSASQARRRLAGHGFGVRKIRSNGRNQAEIIHTATGQHLRELQQLFSDVLPAAPAVSPAPDAPHAAAPSPAENPL